MYVPSWVLSSTGEARIFRQILQGGQDHGYQGALHMCHHQRIVQNTRCRHHIYYRYRHQPWVDGRFLRPYLVYQTNGVSHLTRLQLHHLSTCQLHAWNHVSLCYVLHSSYYKCHRYLYPSNLEWESIEMGKIVVQAVNPMKRNHALWNLPPAIVDIATADITSEKHTGRTYSNLFPANQANTNPAWLNSFVARDHLQLPHPCTSCCIMGVLMYFWKTE